MGLGTAFQPILPYKNLDKIEQCETIFLTSGKFVYDIDQLLTESKPEKTCLLAIEELYPFPEGKLSDILKKASPNAKVYWVQE